MKSPLDRMTLALVGVGFALRLFFIFPGPLTSKIGFLANHADLNNYFWPAETALQGKNPYVLWASGQSGDARSDMEPLELAVYVATVRIWDDPRAIQVLFALFDAVNIALLALVLWSSRLRLPFQLFYALGPLTLYNLTLVPEDKSIALTLSFLVFLLLTRPREELWSAGPFKFRSALLAIAAAAVLASFKWVSAFYLVPLLLWASPSLRGFVRGAALFGTIVVLGHLPWFPDWIYVYTFRAQRIATPLVHIAPASLLNAVGLYNRFVLLAAVAAALAAIYGLYWLKRLDIFEALALSVTAGILGTPDMDPVHLSLVVIYLLLIVDWSGRLRVAAVWALSLVVTAVYAISTHAAFGRFDLAGLHRITGDYGSPQMIVWSYLLFIAVFGFYLIDKRRGRFVGGSVVMRHDD
ncbi:MAG: hypothetical protein M1570_02025 [Chloroflexi bacterium]|nr:hypothetical protein [Chloroflexota bacterium]